MSEYNDLEKAKKAATQLGTSAGTLIGIAFNKTKNTVQDVYEQIKHPLSLEEQAKRTVEAVQKSKVRSEKVAQASARIGSTLVRTAVVLPLAMTKGIIYGALGYVDKTTRVLAEQGSDEEEDDAKQMQMQMQMQMQQQQQQ